MFNQSAEYALRATLYIAHQGPQGAYTATALADALGVPANYLSKVMHGLVRAHVLRSVRGPNGGYSLAVDPSELRLHTLIAPFQELEPRGRCLVGDRACDHNKPCAAHQRWGRMKDDFAAFLQNTTVADMLTPLPTGGEKMVTLTEVA